MKIEDADELRKRAYSDYERLNMAIDELERQTCETPRNNLAESLQDCISREEALKVMCDKCPMYNCVTGCSSYRHIEKLPSVQPQPKKGKWEVIRKEYEFMGSVVNEPQGCKCSNCGGIVKFKSDFCPSCGADMRESEDEE